VLHPLEDDGVSVSKHQTNSFLRCGWTLWECVNSRRRRE
jgi:hypothetical protein